MIVFVSEGRVTDAQSALHSHSRRTRQNMAAYGRQHKELAKVQGNAVGTDSFDWCGREDSNLHALAGTSS